MSVHGLEQASPRRTHRWFVLGSLVVAGAWAGLTGCGERETSAPEAIDLRGPLPLADRLSRGETLYRQHCLTCHQADGWGVPNLQPALVEARTVVAEDTTDLIRVLLFGSAGYEPAPDEPLYGNAMPGFGFLSDSALADIATYVRLNYGNKTDAVAAEQVSLQRDQP